MRFFTFFMSSLLILLVAGLLGFMEVYNYYSQDLPDFSYLKDYQPATLTRVYADDGRMMATFAAERRVFAPIDGIPDRVKEAFISAEDQNFYEHHGLDYMGIARAVLINLKNFGQGRRPVGASTITQQVAKNMLLGNEVSMSRKIREAILALRLERVLSKDRILELYLNEIFLGNHAYGVEAAAQNYFNKSLPELTIAEAAYLGALPKAPNNYNPVQDHAKAVERRNWVIGRMAEDGYITEAESEAAQKDPLAVSLRDASQNVAADYFAEEVRKQLIGQFGEDTVMRGGLAVKTSLDPRLQDEAAKALREGLIAFDHRERGWRGPVARLASLTDGQNSLKKIAMPAGGEDWSLALVSSLRANEAKILFADGRQGSIPWKEMSWARRELPDDQFGPPIKKPADVLNLGDVVMVAGVAKAEDGKPYPPNTYSLEQIPVVEGAIVALDPHTGRVLAMQGGFSAQISQYNRATQAYRQPGSSFKPFVYMAALDKGFTPSSLILDAPFSYFQGPGLPLWQPENHSKDFYGPTTLRVGIEKSRNVMTARLANAIGMPIIIQYAKKFGVVDDMPELLSFCLGAKETTPLRMATAYGMIDNGGKKITPSLIDRVQDRDGKTIWRADARDCAGCADVNWTPDLSAPDVPDTREQVEDPRTAYQMVSILEGVVQRGTGIRLRDMGIPLAGKTGTTNDSKDAWFIGFTPDLVAAVYVGFDNPKSLGGRETGSSVAIPIFKAFMTEAVKGKPAEPFRTPEGLRMVRVNPVTGALSQMGDKEAIWEAFIPGTEPEDGKPRPVLDGSVTGAASEGAAKAMTPADAVAPPSQMETPVPPDAVPVIPSAPPSSSPPEPQGLPPASPPESLKRPTAEEPVGTGGLY